VVDKYTVKIHLKDPDAGFLHVLGYISPVMGILSKKDVESQGGTITKHLIGTGPFKFVEWKPDRHVKLEKFNEYKGPSGPRDGMGGDRTPYLDKITFVPIREESVAVMSLLNREVDLLVDFPIKYMDKYESEYSKKGIVAEEVPGTVWVGVNFIVTNPVVNNETFRKACAYALDIEALAKAGFMGHAEINPTVIPKSSQYWTPYHQTHYKHDLTKAKQLLKESGYNGEEVLLDTTKQFNYFYTVGVAAQAQLRAAGINVKLNVVDWPVLLDRILSGPGKSQMFIVSSTPSPDPALAYGSVQRNNKLVAIAPDSEELRERARKTDDIATRRKIFEQIHKICYEKVPWVLIGYYNYIHAKWGYVKGYEIQATGIPRLWGVWLDR
jgi:peptide/nickel transport system substrate-binding protein